MFASNNESLKVFATYPREPEILYFCHPKDSLGKKGPPLNTVIGSSTNGPAKIVMSATVWTMHYLDSAKRQLHNFDLSKPLYIITSQRKNPRTLYLQCPKRWCDFFQWLDQAYDRVSYVLEMGQNFFLESYLLCVIIDFRGTPILFHFIL